METRSTFLNQNPNPYHRGSLPSLIYVMQLSGDYLSRLRTTLKAEPTRAGSKRVPRPPFARLASERLRASVSASSRRCLLQEWRSYIASILCLSPLGSALPFTLRRRLPLRGRIIGQALASYAELTLYGIQWPKVNCGAGAPLPSQGLRPTNGGVPYANASSYGLRASAQQSCCNEP